jgi:hypothetical protein
MHRRTAIKKLGLITGGLIFLPSCNFSEEKASVVLKNLQITVKQEEIIKNMVSVIIPEGDIPGAGSLGVDNFVWIMIDDMLSKERQKKFIKGLDLFNSEVTKKHGYSFEKLNKEDQLKALLNIYKNTKSSEISGFITTTRNLVRQGYMQSKYIMTEIMPYPLVPGSYGNCKEINPEKRINIYG